MTAESSTQNKSLIQLSNGEYRTYKVVFGGEIEQEIATPKMISNTDPSGRAFAKDIYSSAYDAWRGFDQDEKGTYSSRSGSGGVGFLGYEFDKPTLIAKYAVRSVRYSDGMKMMPKDWTFDGSNDGISWVILDAQRSQSWSTINTDKKYMIKTPNVYKMYRLNWTANNGHTHTDINEIKLYRGNVIGVWESIPSSTVDEKTFTQHGMTDLSIIPQEAWQELAQLSPTVEIVTYVPEGNKVQSFTETYMDIPCAST